MTEPEIPQKRPYPMQVEAGKEYHVCMCGKSQNQPLCDGSHAGSGLGPKIFKATEAGFIAFCGCKHSKDETGKCDGTHSTLWSWKMSDDKFGMCLICNRAKWTHTNDQEISCTKKSLEQLKMKLKHAKSKTKWFV